MAAAIFDRLGLRNNGLKGRRIDLDRLIGSALRHRWMNEQAMARLRAEIIANREAERGASDQARPKLVAAIRRKQDQVSRIVNAIADAGHHPGRSQN